MKSKEGGCTEVYLNKKKVGEYKGMTGLYTDVKIELNCEDVNVTESVTLEIRINEAIHLCYFRMK